jgi:purine-binding chemotaxis protein CheW
VRHATDAEMNILQSSLAAMAATQPSDMPADMAEAGFGRALLRMTVGDEAVAVAIDEVREILEVGRLTVLPRTPDFVRGVMNLRGAVVPVIDLMARLGHAPAQIGRRSCVVVVESSQTMTSEPQGDGSGEADAYVECLVVGLLVDAVYEVFEAPPGDFEPVPPLGTPIDACYLQGMSRVRNEVIGVLALDRVLAQKELTALIGNT